MSANYNKIEGNQAVRVGNWYEEQELKAVTGQTRSAQWVAPSNANQQGDFEPMHTKLKGHPDMMDSTMRVFFHSDYIEPKDYKAASQMFREDPWRKYEEKGVGARTAMMERRASELAAAEMRAEEEAAGAALAQEQLHGRGLTEAKASFLGAVPARGDDPSRGKRIMYTQDGAPAHRDARFLVESGLLAPHLAVDVAPIDWATLPAEAITYADRMLVTGQTRAPNAASYSRVRNDFFSKPIELSKKPGIWADADDDHVYPSIAAARGS